MTIRSYESHSSSRNIWVCPALFIVVAILGHIWSGALHWPIESADHQRDFNTALGITLLTGLFWVAIQAIHQNVASTLIAVLLDYHQLSHFNQHRWALCKKFERQLILCCCLAPVMPFFYLVNQGLLTRFDEAGVFMITLSAIPFWLIVFLFLAQVTTNTQYVFRLAFNTNRPNASDIKLYKAVFDMALANAKYALGGIAILPVFWFNKPVPALDILIVSMGVGVLVLYLFIPVWRVSKKIHTLRAQIRTAIDGEVTAIIRQQANGDPIPNISATLETLYQQRDQVIRFVNPSQRNTLLLSSLSLPVSILLITCIERLIGG